MRSSSVVSFSVALVLALAFTPALALAGTLMLDFGPTTPTGANLTNSPLHTASGGSFTDTSWNVVGTADVGSGLLFSDGSAATGVAIDLGVSPTSAIDLATQPGSMSALGGFVNTGVYDGDSVGKDAIFQTYASSSLNQSFIGAQITGLAAGSYNVYVADRNTSTTSVSSFDGFVGTGAVGNFDVSGYITANVIYESLGATTSWVEEGGVDENYIKFTVNVASGDSLNIAVAGNITAVEGATENRGFLSLIQITEVVPEPSSVLLLGLGLLGSIMVRRRSVS